MSVVSLSAAAGAWILRCRCKHKHIDHDASKATHPCKRERCSCTQFDRYRTTRGCVHYGGGGCIQSHLASCRSLVFHARSPWVCNCDHAWTQHKQVFRKKTVFTMNGVPIPTSVAAEMNLVARGSNPTQSSGPRPDDGGYAVTEVT